MASAITPDVVQKINVLSTVTRGTPLRLVKYFFKLTKAAQNDWVVTATYFRSGTPLYWNVCTIDSSSDGVSELTDGVTYTNTGTKLTFTSATVGTVYGEVVFSE